MNDPDKPALAVQLQGAIQAYRNAISGTAYSDQEGRDINSIFPGIDKSQTLNDAITKGRTKLFDSSIDAFYRTALGNAYDDLKDSNKETSLSDNIIDQENNAKEKVIAISKTNPKMANAIRPYLTQGYSYIDIMSAFPEYFK